MAYIKLSQIKSEGYLKRAINYILNPQKTENGMNTVSYMCSTEFADLEFAEVRKQAVKKGKVIAHEIYQSFSPEDDITPQKALAIGRELMRRTFPDFQYVIATHNDKEHIHNHIIICAVNFNDFHMFPNKLATLEKVRQASNELCEEYGYSVITPNPKGYRKVLKAEIDEIIENCDTYNDFFREMKKRGYEIKIGKYISVKGLCDKSFIRISTLGSAYTEKNIRRRIEEKAVIENVERNVYSNSIKRIPQRSRLKRLINSNLKSADSFDEFISLMKNEYAVKNGKHLAFKHETGKRFLRLESLGEEYSEEMLRLYFSDLAEYKTRLDEISARKISRLKAADETARRYIYRRNAHTEIKMLNYLHACNIQSYEVLKENISQLEKRIADCKSDIQKINAQISAKRSITNAVRDYWRYKPIQQKYLSITDIKSKEKYL
ncbi:MAG: relaxase/mobilization nuclease domain-containing protein, partial [Firmicutes bacterium]|nr:relaxase/mobilization nuclease domain-containing protein [Bacillota bacterium]